MTPDMTQEMARWTLAEAARLRAAGLSAFDAWPLAIANAWRREREHKG
jgi:hypothetical protein